jgi:hypothetical protein
MRLAQTAHNGGREGDEVGVVVGVQALFFDKLPQALDQVKVRGVRWQEAEFNMQAERRGRHQGTFLLTGIIQKQGDGNVQVEARQLIQQLTDLF